MTRNCSLVRAAITYDDRRDLSIRQHSTIGESRVFPPGQRFGDVSQQQATEAPPVLNSVVFTDALGMTLTWTPTGGEDSFDITREETGGGPTSFVLSPDAGDTTASDPGPFLVGQNYRYRIFGVFGGKSTAASNPVAEVATSFGPGC